ncbi:MAG: hypothetical protein ACRDQ6_23700 [Pseudonocardiaceae bacterium]
MPIDPPLGAHPNVAVGHTARVAGPVVQGPVGEQVGRGDRLDLGDAALLTAAVAILGQGLDRGRVDHQPAHVVGLASFSIERRLTRT